MQKVIIQLEGIGAYRVPAALAETVRALAPHQDCYVTDGCGRTWAPGLGEWILWDGVACDRMR